MPLPKHTLFYGLNLTEEQTIYGNSIIDNLVTFCQARAGSGKTTIAVGTAKLMLGEQFKSVHYIFPTVEEKALGYSTGDIKAKEAKYLIPLFDAITEIGELPYKAIKNTFNEKQGTWWVDAYSHNYMRGGNIKNAIVIIDEAQNLTKKELRKILTRCHDSCHVIVTGDINQCDIPLVQSGFIPYLDHYRTTKYSLACDLTKNFRGVISAHAETM
jgi:phosphate starvation-inducible PhoH-like protein